MVGVPDYIRINSQYCTIHRILIFFFVYNKNPRLQKNIILNLVKMLTLYFMVKKKIKTVLE